jgi:hypothetical protein
VLEKLMDIAVLRNENERLKEQLARTQAALAESEEAPAATGDHHRRHAPGEVRS